MMQGAADHTTVETIVMGLFAAIPPTLTAFAVLVKMRNDRIAREQDKAEAIAAREAIEVNRERDKEAAIAARGQLKQEVAQVHTLVNSKADVQIDTIKALKKEIARLHREPGEPTPTIEAGQGAPGEVGIDHGVVTAEREGPFRKSGNAAEPEPKPEPDAAKPDADPWPGDAR